MTVSSLERIFRHRLRKNNTQMPKDFSLGLYHVKPNTKGVFRLTHKGPKPVSFWYIYTVSESRNVDIKGPFYDSDIVYVTARHMEMEHLFDDYPMSIEAMETYRSSSYPSLYAASLAVGLCQS